MVRYILCGCIAAVVWIFNGKWILHAAKEKIKCEMYMHTGLGVFFTMITLELTLGPTRPWRQLGIGWLSVTGFLLSVPSLVLVTASLAALMRKGHSKTPDFTETALLIDSGIYGIIRQPMTLGMAVWSVSQILIFQSVPALILGLISLFCFRMSAVTESEYDIGKFGNAYKEYMVKVPLWNVFRGFRR